QGLPAEKGHFMLSASRPHEPLQGCAALRGLPQLHRDQSGNVAILFSLLVIPLVALIGLAVDFGHVYKVTSHTQAALDAAALAAGRGAQLNPSNTVAQASAAATPYINQ